MKTTDFFQCFSFENNEIKKSQNNDVLKKIK